MGYFLRRAALGQQVIIEIDEARYEHLKQAKKTLVDAGAFEEHYEQLLGNFKAFEMYCGITSLRAAVELDFRYETWAMVISDANRHAINFLSTARQYADQVVRDFKHLALDEPFEATAKRLLSKAYDTTLAYRFVCEMRNYVQHRAFAVHGTKGRSRDSSWLEGTVLYSQKKLIAEDKGKFKQRVLDELDENIDLLMMFRGYMAAVSRVQIALRKQVEQEWLRAREAIQEAMDEFAQAQRDNPVPSKPAIGLTVAKGDGKTFTDAVMLLLDWDDARVLLSSKNARPIKVPETQ